MDSKCGNDIDFLRICRNLFAEGAADLCSGDSDVIIPVAEARSFVARMRATSTNAVGYVELPGTGHGFDLTDGRRTGAAVRAIGLFLDHVYRTRKGAPAVAVG